MRFTVFFAAAFVVFAGLSGAAQALTAEECREVSERYGVRAIGCDAPADTAAAAPEPSAPAVSWESLRESHVFFASGTSLDSGEAQRLALLVRVLETSVLADACLRLVGYSDSSGPADANLELSRKRAEMIAQYLGANMSDGSRVTEVIGMGEANLLAGFAPDAREHRRVAIYAKRCAAM